VRAWNEINAAVQAQGGVTVGSSLDPSGAAAGVDGFVADTEGTTATMGLDADPGAAEDEAAGFRRDTDRSTATIGVDANTAIAAAVLLSFLARPRKADVYVDLPNIEAVNGYLNTAARARTATITADANTGTAERELNSIARDRTATITARVIESDIARWYRLNGRITD
jgi:hypothetical protein